MAWCLGVLGLDIFWIVAYNVCILFNIFELIAHMSPVSTTPPDHQKLYEIAEQQAGYFTAAQAQAVGFSRPLLSYHTKTGRFGRISQGIYRLSQFPGSPYEDLFVAWLRTGPDSVISHESALAVYELSDVLPGEVHVIIPRTASRRRKGIRLHTNRLRSDEVTMRAGLPITTVARTIADVIASGLAQEQVGQAIREALQRGLTTRESLLAQAARRGGQIGQVLQRLLQQKWAGLVRGQD
jgi:predicted transcriptional regulator of viral defense system